MSGKTITRVDLYAAVYRQAGLSRAKSLALVELVFKEITDTLAKGETVSLADELRRRRIHFVFATGYSQDVVPSRFSDVTRFEKLYDPVHLARHVIRLCQSSLHHTS